MKFFNTTEIISTRQTPSNQSLENICLSIYLLDNIIYETTFKMNKTKIYFPSLDGLRFFAFLLVFLHHIFQNYQSNNPILNYLLIILQKNGWVGVDLFFVLSGFLITTLLLEERKKFSSFSIKNFWIRRSLRIWPLYYLALLFGFIIIPLFLAPLLSQNYRDPKLWQEFSNQFLLYIAFLGNWATSLYSYSNFKYIAHLWTISIEEQFYLLWPLVLLLIRNLRLGLLVSLLIIVGALITRLVLSFQGVQHPGIYTSTFARVDTLTFGSLLALICFYKPHLIEKFKSKFCSLPFQIAALILLSFFLYKFYFFDPYRITNGVFGYLIIALFMTYFTLSALHIPSLFAKFLSRQPLVKLGKISYGLYVWHILALDIAFIVCSAIMPRQALLIAYPILAFLLTLLLGFASYHFFESYFLKKKSRFTKIETRSL